MWHCLDLEQAVCNSNQEIVGVKQLRRVFDYKSWLLPYIETPPVAYPGFEGGRC